jgi:hypothetical protein
MTITAASGLPYQQTELRSRLLFHWRAAHLTTTPITLGNDPTFARANSASATDSEGNTVTSVHSQPRWQVTTSEPGLLIVGTNTESLYWDYPAIPQAQTAYIRFVERGSLAIASARLFHIGHQTSETTDARFYVDSTGSFYRVTHDNGTTVPTATLAAAPSTTDVVEIRAVLNADGSVLIGQSINSAAESTANDATAATLQGTWAGEYLHLGGVGSAVDGNAEFQALKIAAGVRTMAQMRTVF